MKISLSHIENAVSQLKYKLLGYGTDKEDLHISVSVVSADPGNGVMVDCILLTAQAPDKEGQNKVISATAEIFPSREEQEPRFSITESWTIKSKH